MGVKHSNINTITNYSEWTEQNFEKQNKINFKWGILLSSDLENYNFKYCEDTHRHRKQT